MLGVLAPIAIPDPLARLERLCNAFEDDELVLPRTPVARPLCEAIAQAALALDLSNRFIALRGRRAWLRLGAMYRGEGDLRELLVESPVVATWTYGLD